MMRLKHMQKVRDGKYLKNYELTYENKAGREKTFELVSRNDLDSPADLGQEASGVSIIAYQGNRILLLKEFRMSINRSIYNLCAGMLETGESIEECIARELYEETGLKVERILSILPPSYSAVGFSDTSTYIAFVEAAGQIGGRPSDNEEIQAAFYTREQIREMLNTEVFSSRSQIAAYFFSIMEENE